MPCSVRVWSPIFRTDATPPLFLFVDRILPGALSGHKLFESIALFNRIEPTPFENDLTMGDFPYSVSPFETVHVTSAKGQIFRRRLTEPDEIFPRTT